MAYICKFRRNNKERYWETRKVATLYDFKGLLEEMFEKTTENKLQIIVVKLEKKINEKGAE